MRPFDAVLLALAALMVGASVPVLVQLFVSVRALQRSALATERRIDGTLQEVSAALARLPPPSSQAAATLGAALAPAVVAAIRSLRSHGHAHTNANGSTAAEGRPTGA